MSQPQVRQAAYHSCMVGCVPLSWQFGVIFQADTRYLSKNDQLHKIMLRIYNSALGGSYCTKAYESNCIIKSLKIYYCQDQTQSQLQLSLHYMQLIQPPIYLDCRKSRVLAAKAALYSIMWLTDSLAVL